MGSATVPVAPVGVSPTGEPDAAGQPDGLPVPSEKVFGGTPKTAGETPRAPHFKEGTRLQRSATLSMNRPTAEGQGGREAFGARAACRRFWARQKREQAPLHYPYLSDAGRLNPNGIPAQSHRVARHDLPWETSMEWASTPTGLRPCRGVADATPLGLECFSAPHPG